MDAGGVDFERLAVHTVGDEIERARAENVAVTKTGNELALAIIDEELARGPARIVTSRDDKGTGTGTEKRVAIKPGRKFIVTENVMQESWEDIEMGRESWLERGRSTELIVDRNACLHGVEVGSVKDSSLLEKFFAVIPCQNNDRFFALGQLMEPHEKLSHEAIDKMDGIPIPVLDPFNRVVGAGNMEVVDRLRGGMEGLFRGPAIAKMGRF